MLPELPRDMHIERNRGHYTLGGPDGHDAIPYEGPLLEWARQFETTNRRVAEDFIGPYRVSTVFLGLDHSLGFLLGRPDGKPHIFETMMFAPNGDQTTRCSTWDEALKEHAAMVKLALRTVNG